MVSVSAELLADATTRGNDLAARPASLAELSTDSVRPISREIARSARLEIARHQRFLYGCGPAQPFS